MDPKESQGKDSSRLAVIHSNKILLLSPGFRDLLSPGCCRDQYIRKSKAFTANTVTANKAVARLSWVQNDHDYCCSDAYNPHQHFNDVEVVASDLLEVDECKNTTSGETHYVRMPSQSCNDFLPPLALDSSTVWYSSLQTRNEVAKITCIGISLINLEKLADTGYVCESAFQFGKLHRAQDERDCRVQERREIFQHTMQQDKGGAIESRKQICGVLRNNICAHPSLSLSHVLENWLKLDTLTVDETSTLLEDTADILYNMGDTFQHFPHQYATSVVPKKTRRRLFKESSPKVNTREVWLDQAVNRKLSCKILATNSLVSIPNGVGAAYSSDDYNSSNMTNITRNQDCSSVRALRSRKVAHKARRTNNHDLAGIAGKNRSVSATQQWIAHTEDWIKHSLDTKDMLKLIS